MSIANVLRIMSKALEEIAEEIEQPESTGTPIKERKVSVKKKKPAAKKKATAGSAKKKPTPKKPAKKAVAKKKPAAPVKKQPVQKAASKKKTPPKSKVSPNKKQKTAAEVILGVIGRAKGPVEKKVIIKKTGFKIQKVSDGLYDLKKRGQIRNAGRGVYVKV